MKSLVTYFKITYLIVALALCSGVIKADKLSQENSISFFNYEVHHQGINNLNIKFTWKQSGNTLNDPIFSGRQFIFSKMDSFFQYYPNTTDWWEIVNKSLTQMILNAYPEMDSVESNIEVTWVSGAGVDYGHRYPTRCVTTRTRDGKLYEYFGFRTLPDFAISTSSDEAYHAHLDVLYCYIEPIANSAYPDGLATENAFKAFLNEFSRGESIEEASKKCAKEMLKKFPEIAEITSEIETQNTRFARTTRLILKR